MWTKVPVGLQWGTASCGQSVVSQDGRLVSRCKSSAQTYVEYVYWKWRIRWWSSYTWGHLDGCYVEYHLIAPVCACGCLQFVMHERALVSIFQPDHICTHCMGPLIADLIMSMWQSRKPSNASDLLCTKKVLWFFSLPVWSQGVKCRLNHWSVLAV